MITGQVTNYSSCGNYSTTLVSHPSTVQRTMLNLTDLVYQKPAHEIHCVRAGKVFTTLYWLCRQEIAQRKLNSLLELLKSVGVEEIAPFRKYLSIELRQFTRQRSCLINLISNVLRKHTGKRNKLESDWLNEEGRLDDLIDSEKYMFSCFTEMGESKDRNQMTSKEV